MSEATSTLLSYGGKFTRDQLALVTTPPATATHRPVPHSEVIKALLETLGFRHIAVVKDEYAVSKDGMKMSRRTVAKYRDQMNIPGSRERRAVI